MANAYQATQAQEFLSEQRLLSKAEADIEQGWKRLRNQQDLLSRLQTTGHDTKQAEVLVQLLKQTLIEWDRHRSLIEQRIAYLQEALAGGAGESMPGILRNSAPISNR
jgi:hypothetical protein